MPRPTYIQPVLSQPLPRRSPSVYRNLLAALVILGASTFVPARDLDPAKPTPVKPGKPVPLNPATKPAVVPGKPDVAPTTKPAPKAAPTTKPTTTASGEHFPTPQELFEQYKAK